MMGVCLTLVSGAASVFLPVQAFSLSWMHSVEKITWREHYRVEHRRLVLDRAMVEGSGAGMDPPEGSRFVKGWWVYVPQLPPLPEITLARSTFTPPYTLCADGHCTKLTHWLPPQPTTIAPCAGPKGKGGARS